jgi:hypothetical protein
VHFTTLIPRLAVQPHAVVKSSTKRQSRMKRLQQALSPLRLAVAPPAYGPDADGPGTLT